MNTELARDLQYRITKEALAMLVIVLCLGPSDEVTGSRAFIRAYFPAG